MVAASIMGSFIVASKAVSYQQESQSSTAAGGGNN
jgi:hypothetical protein